MCHSGQSSARDCRRPPLPGLLLVQETIQRPPGNEEKTVPTAGKTARSRNFPASAVACGYAPSYQVVAACADCKIRATLNENADDHRPDNRGDLFFLNFWRGSCPAVSYWVPSATVGFQGTMMTSPLISVIFCSMRFPFFTAV